VSSRNPFRECTVSSVPRRAVLIGALAPLASIPPSPAVAPVSNGQELVAAAESVSPAILELRRLVLLARAAIDYECSLEDQPGYADACARSDALEGELNTWAKAVWSRRPETWGDCILRAELANYWAYRNPTTNELEDLSAEFMGERALAELLQAVLTMGCRDV
jgi:hypothetical protein